MLITPPRSEKKNVYIMGDCISLVTRFNNQIGPRSRAQIFSKLSGQEEPNIVTSIVRVSYYIWGRGLLSFVVQARKGTRVKGEI
jgi:hypothetical protein